MRNTKINRKDAEGAEKRGERRKEFNIDIIVAQKFETDGSSFPTLGLREGESVFTPS